MRLGLYLSLGGPIGMGITTGYYLVLRYHQVWEPSHPTWSLLLPVSSSGPLELEPSLLPGIRTRFFCLEKEAEARNIGGGGKGK